MKNGNRSFLWKRNVSMLLAAALTAGMLAGCGAAKSTDMGSTESGMVTAEDTAAGSYDDYGMPNTEEYNAVDESGFTAASVSPLSTFSADVDTASYSNLRRMIEDGYCLEEIPDGSVRIEELLNYFHYDYVRPEKDEPFGVTTQIADCPWNPNSKIAMIGLNDGH